MPTTLRDSRFAVLTIVTPKIADWAGPAAERTRKYCSRHGYDFACQTGPLDQTRPAAWGKLRFIWQFLEDHPKCEWVFWTDADSVIMNPAVCLESFTRGGERGT